MKLLIYGLTDPRTSAIRYVGKSTQGLLRPKSHARRLDGDDSHKGNWLRSLRAAGHDYGIVVLEEIARREDLDAAEIRWIAHGRAQGWPLTNVLAGGEGAPHTEVTKAKIRAACADPVAREKMSAANRGRPKPREQVAKLADALRGRRATDETRASQSAAHKGRVFSEETRARIAESKRGKPRPDVAERNRSRAQREATAAANRGKPRPDLAERNASPEQRAKVSAALRGRKFSEETLARMREGQRRRRERDNPGS